MSNESPGPWVRLLALAGFVAGPSAALLHEVGLLSLGPSATLWPIGFVVFVAAGGMVMGLRVAAVATRSLGLIVALPNLLVLTTYGFLLVFFGLGGSR